MPRAAKVCNEPGCPNLVRDPIRRRCDEHYQPWQGFNRHKGIAHREMRQNTAEHRALKEAVLRRAEYRCQIGYSDICSGLATQVDRIDNALGYLDGNTQACCEPCHQRKSSREGRRARRRNV